MASLRHSECVPLRDKIHYRRADCSKLSVFNHLKLQNVGTGALKGMSKTCIGPSLVQMFLKVAKNKQTLQKELSLQFAASVSQNSFSRDLKKNPSLIRASSDPP